MQFLQVIRIAYVHESPGEPSEAVSENLNYESMIFPSRQQRTVFGANILLPIEVVRMLFSFFYLTCSIIICSIVENSCNQDSVQQ